MNRGRNNLQSRKNTKKHLKEMDWKNVSSGVRWFRGGGQTPQAVMMIASVRHSALGCHPYQARSFCRNIQGMLRQP